MTADLYRWVVGLRLTNANGSRWHPSRVRRLVQKLMRLYPVEPWQCTACGDGSGWPCCPHVLRIRMDRMLRVRS